MRQEVKEAMDLVRASAYLRTRELDTIDIPTWIHEHHASRVRATHHTSSVHGRLDEFGLGIGAKGFQFPPLERHLRRKDVSFDAVVRFPFEGRQVEIKDSYIRTCR